MSFAVASRRHVEPSRREVAFAERLARRYQERSSGETLMVNELYLTLLYRPVTGAGAELLSHSIARRDAGEAAPHEADALEACAKLRQTVRRLARPLRA